MEFAAPDRDHLVMQATERALIKRTSRCPMRPSRRLASTFMLCRPFRYNNRKNINDQGEFEAAMSNVFGHRLTYSALTGAAISH